MFHENEYIDIVDKRYFKIDQHLARHFKYNGVYNVYTLWLFRT